MQSVSIFERTTNLFQYDFLLNNTNLLTRETTLNNTTKDFGVHPNEHYDVFISDDDGSVNAGGAYITIELFFPQASGGGGNITDVRLNFLSGSEFADRVTQQNFFGVFASPSSAVNAVDGIFSTQFQGSAA